MLVAAELLKILFFCSNISPNNDNKCNLLVCQGSSKVLLDVRIHHRSEVEILDVSEQIDDEHLGGMESKSPGFTGDLRPSSSRKHILASLNNDQLSAFSMVVNIRFPYV
jgi:hypothetical protein